MTALRGWFRSDGAVRTRRTGDVVHGPVAAAGGLALAVLLVGCTGSQPSTPATGECDGIPANAGGCSPDRPVFTGETCADLAIERGKAIDTRLHAVIEQPKDVDGQAWSTRISDVMVLATMVIGRRMWDLGIAEECDTPGFLPVAREQFTDDLDTRILTVLFDGSPASPADWDAELYRYIGVIDDDSPGASVPPAG